MKKLGALFFVALLLLVGAYQIPTIKPCSPITCPLVVFRGDVTVEGTFTSTGTTAFDEVYIKDNTTAAYFLILDSDSDSTILTANRTIIFDVNNADRVIDLAGNLTVEASSIVNQDLTTDATVTFGTLTTTGKISGGSWGTGIALTDSVTSAMHVYGQVSSALTAGKVVRGTWNRALVSAAQTNMVTIVGSENQIRVPTGSNLGDGVHAGIWAYFEQSGTVTLASPGQNTAISATVEGSNNLTLDSGATLSGLVIDSSVHDDASINGNFDAIWIKVSSGKEAWGKDIRLQNSETIDNATDGIITLVGKLAIGSQASPQDVSATREYGTEFHYSGNDYHVTALRARAQLVTTDADDKHAYGAMLQAANNNGIDADVLNGAIIEAVGKSTSTAATIDYMRGAIINTEWNAKDTVGTLQTLYVRTHTRDAATEGYISGSGYLLYLENEAVGGNGQVLDAGIYLKQTNLSGGNNAFTYGIDLSGAAGKIATADIRLGYGETIKNTTDGYVTISGITRVTSLQASGAALLLQDDAAQDVKMFGSASAGENKYFYVYGDQTGSPMYLRTFVDTSGRGTVEAEGGLRIVANSTMYFYSGNDLILRYAATALEVPDDIYFDLGTGSDYRWKYNNTSKLLEGIDGGDCTGASMEYGDWIIKKTVNHDDSSPVVCATVADGYIVVAVYVEIVETWDGNGTINMGDGDDTDGFLPDAGITQGAAAYYGWHIDERGDYLWHSAGGGTGHEDEKIYAGADTVDATLVAGTSSQGQAIVYTLIRRLK